MSKKKRRPGPPAAPPVSGRLLAELAKAEGLIQRGRAGEAIELLRELDQVSPNRVEVLSELLEACYEAKEFRQYQEVCERLLRLRPNDAELTAVMASAYLMNLRPALALRTFRRFLDRWPSHVHAEDARKTVAELESSLRGELDNFGFTGVEGLELAAMHEEAQSLLQIGRYPQARRVEEELLRRHPDFAPALNNISLTYRIEGDLERAITTSERVLAFDPDNFHALANLTQYCALIGREEEAREWAERLKAATSPAHDIWVKQAEAFSYLGDDQGVLDAVHGAEQAGQEVLPPEEALLYHLAAVAALRLGREPEARQYWQRARKLSPGLEVAADNLDDLRRPIGQRHAPWPFNIAQWVSQDAFRELAMQTERASRRGDDEQVAETIRRFLSRHPEILALIPILLDRGDPESRQFAMMVAGMAKTPETVAALRDFALGQRGPDAMRLEAAQLAAQAGLLASGPVRLWVEGEWQEIMIAGFELYDEPATQHSPEVEEWVREATLALRRHDAQQAEQLLHQALAVEPDAPDILNNLAAAAELRGRSKEAHALVRQIFERHPDYLFARANIAQLCIRDGKLDEAEALLKPLLERRRLHFSEFSALCAAQVELFLARGNRAAARSWLQMWEGADPEHPALDAARQRVERASVRRGLFRRLGV